MKSDGRQREALSWSLSYEAKEVGLSEGWTCILDGLLCCSEVGGLERGKTGGRELNQETNATVVERWWKDELVETREYAVFIFVSPVPGIIPDIWNVFKWYLLIELNLFFLFQITTKSSSSGLQTTFLIAIVMCSGIPDNNSTNTSCKI